MNNPIYLDYAASTPVAPEVADLMRQHLTLDGTFGNPASRSHVYGWQAEEAVEAARVQVAEVINADPREIIWTSGATESNNLAIKGLLGRAERTGRRHIITSSIEHKAVLDCAAYLQTLNFEVTYLPPDEVGRMPLDRLREAIRADTLVVSLMQVNNELGVINDIDAIADLCREAGVLSHTDAAQSFGKMKIDVKASGVDLMSISGHKIYGPKGVGALFVRRAEGLKLDPLIHGGGHELGMRSGTLPTHQLVGLGAASQMMADELSLEWPRIEALRQRFEGHLRQIPGCHVHSADRDRLPHIINVGFDGVQGETLMLALNSLALSSGSACNSAAVEPSHVLLGIGLPRALADASLRFSFGRFTDEDQIDQAAAVLSHTISQLRR